MIDKTPRHAWIAHPRLNPAFEPQADSKFDRGTVAHELILGRGNGYAVVDAPDWRTKMAQTARDSAREEGKTPILRLQLDEAVVMAEVVRARLEEHGIDLGAVAERAERVMLWEDRGGALCRSMLDLHGPDDVSIFDVKTTGNPLSDESLERLIQNLGYDLSAGFYVRGLTHLMPQHAGRFRFYWIFVEDHEPFEIRIKEAGGELLDLGDRKSALAIEKWRRCVEANSWPGYAREVTRASAPPYAMTQWMLREEVDQDAVAMLPLALAPV